MKNRSFRTPLMSLSLLLFFGGQVYAQTPVVPQTESKVILYDNPNFEGPSRSFGIGPHTLLSAADFNDLASSIKVPADLVVIVSEHADAGGGYGLWVDFLEDQPNLADHNLDNKISHLKIIPRRSSGAVWVRNRTSPIGKFEAGHYEVVGRGGGGGGALNPKPLVAKKTRNVPQSEAPRPETSTPVVCTIMGKVTTKDSQYRTLVNRTQITLYRPDGSPTLLSARVIGGEYTILNVPVGTYQARGTGVPPYPVRMGPLGNMGPQAVALGSSMLTCHPDGFSSSVDFEIRSGGG